MDLGDLIAPEAVIGSLKANSKKQAIQAISEKAAARTGIPEREIFETLLQREKLGSTGVGGGIAIPHGKLPGLDRIFGLFARLPKPIDFEALDDQPVDLVFLLLAPEGRGRRSPQGAGADRPPPAQGRRGEQAPRVDRQGGAACRVDGRGDARRRLTRAPTIDLRPRPKAHHQVASG